MLLAVDVGNTQTKLGVFRGDKLMHEWRASTDPRRTPDELALLCGQLLAVARLSFSQEITGVAISSVVPRSTQALREMTYAYFGFPAVVVEPGTKTGIAVATENPREIGADRITNAVAARNMFPGAPVVVVDIGTAIKVDAISGAGEFLGGAIAPGMDTSATALFQATAQLQRVELVAPPTVIGRNTVTSVQSGVVYGTAALVDGLVRRVIHELGESAEVVGTGGLAPVVVGECRCVAHLEPALTLWGLRLIFERNTLREEE